MYFVLICLILVNANKGLGKDFGWQFLLTGFFLNFTMENHWLIDGIHLHAEWGVKLCQLWVEFGESYSSISPLLFTQYIIVTI